MKDGKVVGYEKHENGKIWRIKPECVNKRVLWCCIEEEGEITPLAWYIPHDREDRYTGIDVDGEKLFERDEVEAHYEVNAELNAAQTGVVRFKNGRFVVCAKNSDETEYIFCDIYILIDSTRIIGIEGAANDKSD
jgi:hypothetical protein